MKSKAEQNRIAKLEAFLKVCGVVNPQNMSSTSAIMHAQVGEQTTAFKKFLTAAGWIIRERDNYGGGESQTTYEHPSLSGGILVTEYRKAAHANKVFLFAYS